MTLVVGYQSDAGPVLVGDSLLSWDVAQEPPRRGLAALALKLLVPHPNLCVGYAGIEEFALQAIRGLGVHRDAPFDIALVCSGLRRATVSRRVEFIVATLDPRVVRVIRDGLDVSGSQPFSPIGRRDAFDAFRDAFSSTRHEPRGSVLGRMITAMKVVVEAARHATVGGFVFHVVPTDEGFHYGCSATVSNVRPQRVGPNTPTVLKFDESAAQGSYTETILTPTTPGITAVGVHLAEPERGIVLLPFDHDEPLVHHSCDHREFQRWIRDDLGLHLVSPVIC